MERMEFGDGEFICGGGSTIRCAEKIMSFIKQVIAYYDVSTVNDAGCGNQNWIHRCVDCEYRGFDKYEWPNSTQIDISKEAMPKADLIICRHVLIHMPYHEVESALKLFSESAPLLMASTYAEDDMRKIKPAVPSTIGVRMDLTKWIGEPLAITDDCDDSRLGLWELP